MKTFRSLSHMKYLGSGRHRVTYDCGKFVLKIPQNRTGFDANEREARYYKMFGRKPDSRGIVYARCKLLSNGWLVMGKVQPLEWSHEMPAWSIHVDCRQVGRARDGEIVAYDGAGI